VEICKTVWLFVGYVLPFLVSYDAGCMVIEFWAHASLQLYW